jgi:hypothetical protein
MKYSHYSKTPFTISASPTFLGLDSSILQKKATNHNLNGNTYASVLEAYSSATKTAKKR